MTPPRPDPWPHPPEHADRPAHPTVKAVIAVVAVGLLVLLLAVGSTLGTW